MLICSQCMTDQQLLTVLQCHDQGGLIALRLGHTAAGIHLRASVLATCCSQHASCSHGTKMSQACCPASWLVSRVAAEGVRHAILLVGSCN